jgi:hypothetical protein
MRIGVMVEATAQELADLLSRLRILRPAAPQPVRAWEPTPPPMPTVPPLDVEVLHQLTADDPRRYWYTGRVADGGEREAVDRRTRRRGVFLFMTGWTPGAYVCDDGRIEFEHPWDNPWQGMSWS